ncbi:ANKUB1 [Bugula neritina]|uniref:ANKUB1 n=1 Tax=Bugula neritina TaxID=10212 RepID=A0A7J7K4M2_BUGNE|nr:ANKUB1 [Bugula neritina]
MTSASLGEPETDRCSTFVNMPLRVFLAYDGERHEYFIPDGSLVADIRQEVKHRFLLGQNDGKDTRKIVVLNYLGADLKDDWLFQDIGVLPGATIRISEREEMKPRLYVYCSYNNDKVKIMDKSIEILKTTVADLRTIVTRLVGLPVGVFRLTTSDGQELFDQHTLDRYDLEIGDTINLHTWDGWTDFLNLCMMGYTSHVFAQLSDDEAVSKYQMKVAMHIACHCGHVDLALNLMKQGVRADDPVGYHPYRVWCNVTPHTESLKPPIHECGEQGQEYKNSV